MAIDMICMGCSSSRRREPMRMACPKMRSLDARKRARSRARTF